MLKKLRSYYFFTFFALFITSSTVISVLAVEVVDPNFNTQIQTTTFRPKSVSQMITLPDGKILATGSYNNYNGTPVGALIRLNPDASLDTTFNNDVLAGGNNSASITLQPDGKILLEGHFILSNGTTYVKSIIRLHPDGTIDPSFTYAFTGNIYEVRVDAAGRILVSGFIQVVINGATVNKDIIRLNNNGSLDTSFNAPPMGHCIERFTTQGTKVLYNCWDSSVQQKRLFRLNDDGTPDNSYTSTLIGSFQILEMREQADGKIVVLTDNRISRVNENGGLDPNFQTTVIFSPGQPRKLLLQNDGRITIAHSISSPYGDRIIRLLPSGALDPSFTPYVYLNSSIAGHIVQLDGAVLIGDQGSHTFSNRFMRLLPNGSEDTTFNPGGSGFQNINPGKIGIINVLTSGKILIGGDFDRINNIDRKKIALLNSDSTLDNSFQINTSGTGNYFSSIMDVYQFAIQNDGKIIASGDFTYFVNGIQKSTLVRLDPNGNIDPTFNLGLNISNWHVINPSLGKYKPAQTSSGKILVGTSRTNTTDPMSIPLLLNANGTKDTSFNPTIFNAKNLLTIFDITVLPDGKIMISGTHVSSTITENIRRGFIARLNSNGTVDTTFQILELADKDIFAFQVLPNNQILVVSMTNSQSAVFRLNPDGSYDNSFDSGIGANGRINAIAVLPNNKILVGGLFSSYNNQPRQNLALIGENGALDAGVGNINREVLCIAVDNQGRVLIGGRFTLISSPQNVHSIETGGNIQQVTRSYLARLIISSVTTRKTLFDFDGDGRADVSVFRPSDGVWHTLRSQSGYNAFRFGMGTDKLTPADFDGDGKTDIAVFRDGFWYWLNSSNGSFNAVHFGQAGDIPVPADYDGDGKADIAVYREGVWHLLLSTTGGYTAFQFGISTDKPVPADYDGDGRTDAAVYREGVWHLLRSAQGYTALHFGISTDKPVVGDYDGDGKADAAVYREGVWHLLLSTTGHTALQFGIASDIPTPADYDGDGKTDAAVYREGVWHLLRSTQGYTAMQFGVATDKPVPATFLP